MPRQQMTQPYQPPHASLISGSDDERLRRRRKFWLRAIWVSIAAVIIPLVFGGIGTVVGMIGAFGELADTGKADPEALAEKISISLHATLWGWIVSAIAFLLLLGVLIRFFTLPKVEGAPPSTE